MKATAHTAKIVIRSGIGSSAKVELTDADRDTIQIRKDEQAARLARIAARNARVDIHCEDCDVLDHATVTQDEARAHELKTDHEVVIHIF